MEKSITLLMKYGQKEKQSSISQEKTEWIKGDIKEERIKKSVEGKEGVEAKKSAFKAFHSESKFVLMTVEEKSNLRKSKSEGDITESYIIDEIDEFDLEEVQESIQYTYETHSNQFKELYKMVDIRLFFTELKDLPYNDFFPCVFNKGLQAWISQNQKTKKFSYFFKENNGDVKYLDIYDLMYIYTGLDISHSIKVITAKLKVTYKGGEFMIKEMNKYQYNLEVLENEGTLRRKYPILYKYIEKYLPILSRMQVLGLINLKNEDYQVGDSAIFYKAMSYIGSKIDKEVNRVSEAINCLTALNIIVRIDRELVAKQILDESDDVNPNKQYKDINFYSLAILDEVTLKQAQDIVIDFLSKGIKKDKVTYKAILKHYGLERAKQVFPNNESKITKEKKMKVEVEVEEGYNDDLPF